ncbi:hypothetical protein BT96DRAFT_464226 [Gymnopus androsaceus JB14]|uniref:Long chronological lifespan protein 2 n=1 Tax=Gymnopus androsaceus JB14 TaxID=1447944 RepID=A0A6A4IHF3_9AGAR|nr:hypothetical protein BT96DRAFT_464226 [Gymnopus androsaceus JB14]
MYRLPTLFIAFCWALSLATAQFSFFDQMFGQQQQHQQQHHQSSGGSQDVSCSQYLCPNTLDCVALPHDCPCPDQEDVKCIIPDADNSNVGTVVCARGPEACQSVERIVWRLGK